MTKAFLLFCTLCITPFTFAQKDGTYLSDGDPVNNLWEFVGKGENAAPLVGGEGQKFLFLLGEGSNQCMMSPFEDKDYGFACPTYFTVSSDIEYLYLDIHDSCVLSLSEDDKYVKVKYKMSKDGSELQLTVNGKNYLYRDWNSE